MEISSIIVANGYNDKLVFVSGKKTCHMFHIIAYKNFFNTVLF